MAREGRGGLLHAIRSCSQHVEHKVDRPNSYVSHCIRSGHAARHVEHEVDRPSMRCNVALCMSSGHAERHVHYKKYGFELLIVPFWSEVELKSEGSY
ncbi:hypothetical protein F2Q70_00011002 [Brassica cretica]|uniref:Uncharacterized protein n=1 Tax=Brassica cretica TaxID=69181 RepID=A0A8S9M1L2_BRACR|nr:hypothetical protein F2Q70_00011002 [Brassica cretica]